jgi:hypothetical protein
MPRLKGNLARWSLGNVYSRITEMNFKIEDSEILKPCYMLHGSDI